MLDNSKDTFKVLHFKKLETRTDAMFTLKIAKCVSNADV